MLALGNQLGRKISSAMSLSFFHELDHAASNGGRVPQREPASNASGTLQYLMRNHHFNRNEGCDLIAIHIGVIIEKMKSDTISYNS